MGPWIYFDIFVILLVVVVLFFAAKSAALLSAKHLSEISNGLAGLKVAALKAILRPGELYEKDLYSTQIDQQTFVTSIGLGFMYTISKQDNLYLHHISVSLRSGALAHSSAMTIAAWLAYFLDIPADKISVPPEISTTPGDVWHVTFELSEAEEKRFEASRPRILPSSKITRAVWQEINPGREKIFERSLPGSRPRGSS
ncbi:MAG TPA: hypothetical protein V6C86_18790 [Oculatellaceae cyanobacterium]